MLYLNFSMMEAPLMPYGSSSDNLRMSLTAEESSDESPRRAIDEGDAGEEAANTDCSNGVIWLNKAWKILNQSQVNSYS